MEENDKPVKVKGVATEGEDKPTGAILPKVTKASPYADVAAKNKKIAQLGEIATAPTANFIPGFETGVDKRAVDSLYATLDLAKAIPDQYEREKYIEYNKDKLVQLTSPDKYGVRFTRDLQDYAVFKQKKYDQQSKKFLDDLDENQGFLEALGLTAAKLIGKTAVSIGGLLPTIYGVGSALFNWDKSKIFNNSMFDAWEVMDQGLDKHLAVYGGSGYTQGHKNFFARMVDNPMKSINADVVPAAAFVAGAIGTELAATALAPFTGGTSVVANTARLGAQATRLFSKSVRTLRGLDAVGDFANMRKIVDLTAKYRAGLGTVTSMVRSAGYESALMARSTFDNTYQQLLDNHKKVNGRDATANEKAYYEQKAEEAGEFTWAANIPLVGFSNMIQFSKVFAGGLTVSKALNRLNPFKLTGTSAVGGKVIANADKFNKWQRAALLGGVGLKSGVTEGFEEFAQGVIENGTADYVTAKYTKGAEETAVSYLDAATKAARNYIGTVEGQDSITIGALMGMLGMRMPIKIDSKGNAKFSLRGQHFGGAIQEIKDVKKNIAASREAAEAVKNNSFNPILKANFDNMLSNVTSQAEMDNAIENDDNFTFKNKEFEQTYSHISTKIKQGIGDTVIQEIEALEQLSLEDFNTQFAHPGVKEFTEETKKVALSKFKKQTENIIKAHEQVDTMFNDTKHLVDFWRTDFKSIADKPELHGELKDQMAFLLASSDNLEVREKELETLVHDKTGGKISPSVVNKLVAKVANLTKEGRAEFMNSGNELYKAALQEWKETDINSYNKYVDQVKPLLKDLLKIKAKRAESTALYRNLFTKKGAENFATFHDELKAQFRANVIKAVSEKLAAEVKTAKASEKVVKTASDEASIDGTTPSVDAKLAEEEALIDAELRAVLNEQAPEDVKSVADEAELFDKVDSEMLVSLLQTKPALFAEILNRLANEGNEIFGLTNIDQLEEVLATNPDAEALIASMLATILKENAAQTALVPKVQNFANPLDKDQPAPKTEDAENFEDIFGAKIQEVQSIFGQGSNATDMSIIPITHDKQIVNNKLSRDPVTGRFIKKNTDQPVDNATINSPEFLSNEELANSLKEATFKIADNDWNKTNKNAEDIAIDIYHGEVFIGRLPAYKEGMPSNLLALRQAIIAPTATVTTVKSAGPQIIRKQAQLSNNINDFNTEAQALLNNPNPTYQQYLEVVLGYEFDLSADLPSESLRKSLESELQDIKNSFEISTENKQNVADIIDSNFESIVAQLNIKTDCK